MAEYGLEQVEDLLGDELRSELESAHGEVVAVDVKGIVLAFRLPTRPETKRYRQLISDGKHHADEELEKLLGACCVHPSREKFAEVMERYSMALGSIGIAFMSAAGFDFAKAAIVK